MKTTIYDMIGIGIGPFNLGLAALTKSRTKLKSLFFDQNETFSWHSGMMLNGAKLQVPFHADLVTLADPKSDYSFLCYLRARQRLFRFTIREEYFPLRKEYNDYCSWVAEQLSNLRFGHKCVGIEHDDEHPYYKVRVSGKKSNKIKTYSARHIVIGVGTVPYIPAIIDNEHLLIFHSENYLLRKEQLKQCKRITIVGSGQSAAEIFDDLLEEDKELYWFTRSPRIFPMDYSKFALEMTSPDYIDHFYGLESQIKSSVLSSQSGLYKGINAALISTIYDKLYERSLEKTGAGKFYLYPNSSLENVIQKGAHIACSFTHRETGKRFQHITDALILATGYQSAPPDFLNPVKKLVRLDSKGKYAVRRNYSIDGNNTLFVQNAELHTHGFNAPDLGMGPYRNAVILNTILGKEHFKIEKDVPFQKFGTPSE